MFIVRCYVFTRHFLFTLSAASMALNDLAEGHLLTPCDFYIRVFREARSKIYHTNCAWRHLIWHLYLIAGHKKHSYSKFNSLSICAIQVGDGVVISGQCRKLNVYDTIDNVKNRNYGLFDTFKHSEILPTINRNTFHCQTPFRTLRIFVYTTMSISGSISTC